MWMPFVSSSCLITLARTSSTMLNKSSESKQSCFAPYFKGNTFSFCPLSMMLAGGFSYMAFVMLRYISYFTIGRDSGRMIWVWKHLEIILSKICPLQHSLNYNRVWLAFIVYSYYHITIFEDVLVVDTLVGAIYYKFSWAHFINVHFNNLINTFLLFFVKDTSGNVSILESISYSVPREIYSLRFIDILNCIYAFIYRGRKGEREVEKHWGGRETSIGCLSHTPQPGTWLET